MRTKEQSLSTTERGFQACNACFSPQLFITDRSKAVLGLWIMFVDYVCLWIMFVDYVCPLFCLPSALYALCLGNPGGQLLGKSCPLGFLRVMCCT